MHIQLIAGTQVFQPVFVGREVSPYTGEVIPIEYESDANGPVAIAEIAGRACYQSWHRPNPATATNEGYLKHILEVGHFSVLEHGSVTFLLTGVSRSFTHELVRHRHLSYSHLSQRYVKASESDADGFVCPPALRGMPDLVEKLRIHYRRSVELQSDLHAAIQVDRSLKESREAARAVLPNATETSIVVTGNLRAWRHFIRLRGSAHADAEMREVAVEIAAELKIWPGSKNAFQDVEIVQLDGKDIVRIKNYDQD